MVNSVFLDFNKILVNDKIYYSIKEYIVQFKTRFCGDIDLNMLDNYNLTSRDHDQFTVSEEHISEMIDVRKIIKKYRFEIGLDFISTNKLKNNISALNKLNPFFDKYYIKLTPNSFKKVLILSGNNVYLEYFLFLETIIQNYEEYQKLFNRKTIIDSKKRIQTLEIKIQAHEINKYIENGESMKNHIKSNNYLDINEYDFSSDSS